MMKLIWLEQCIMPHPFIWHRRVFVLALLCVLLHQSYLVQFNIFVVCAQLVFTFKREIVLLITMRITTLTLKCISGFVLKLKLAQSVPL